MRSLSPEYIAGFFDADGTVGYYAYKAYNCKTYYRLQIQFINTDREVLAAIQETLECKGTLFFYDRPSARKRCWRLSYQGKNAARVVRRLESHMIVKRGHAQECLRAHDEHLRNSVKVHGGARNGSAVAA
jgi:hypothetical protein